MSWDRPDSAPSHRAPRQGNRTGLVHALPAGVLDASLNSLGTFAIGLAATLILDPGLLGVFAVFFTAHQTGLVLPMYLIHLPAEVQAVARPLPARLPMLRRSVWLGIAPSVLAGAAVILAVLVMRKAATGAELIGFAWTTGAATVLSPTQTHVRRMLHIAGASWRAAIASGVQLAVALGALFALRAAGAPATWVPFGALALASFLSIVVGLALAAPWRGSASDQLGMRDLVTAGRWLLVTGAAAPAAGFVVAALISHLASPEDLGFAEAARLAAQPILVLGIGLNFVLGPRSMEAAHRRDRAAARRVERLSIVIILSATVIYLLVAGGPWRWNPLYYLVPKAYEVTGLTALMILVSCMVGTVLPAQRELLGARLERKLALIEILAGATAIAVAASASVVGSFARPWSLLGENLWRAIHYRQALRPVYRRPPRPREEEAWQGLLLDRGDL
jgi:hypothetical protein